MMEGLLDCLRIKARSFAGSDRVARVRSAEPSRSCNGGDDRGARLATADTRAADRELRSERRVEDNGIGAIAPHDGVVAACFLRCD
jgi:hypothetical protein